MEAPRSARGAPADELLELAQLLRRELIVREEGPAGEFVESLANGLRSGEKTGWYYPLAAGGGLATRSEHAGTSFAHVHVGPGPDGLARAQALAETILDSLPPTITAACIGFTGLTTEEEDELLARLSRRPGSTPIRRFAMERALSAADGPAPAPLPGGLAQLPVRDVTLEALAELDRRAFAGTVDALLLGTGPEENRRALDAMLSGEIGPFLDHASSVLYRSDPPALVGALLTSERSARHAVFLDFMVDPVQRGHGLGHYLIRWGFRTLWALGYERVRLWVSESNHDARRLYDSVGFHVTHRAVIYRWDRSGAPPQ